MGERCSLQGANDFKPRPAPPSTSSVPLRCLRLCNSTILYTAEPLIRVTILVTPQKLTQSNCSTQGCVEHDQNQMLEFGPLPLLLHHVKLAIWPANSHVRCEWYRLTVLPVLPSLNILTKHRVLTITREMSFLSLPRRLKNSKTASGASQSVHFHRFPVQ